MDTSAFVGTYLLKLSKRRLLARTISALFAIHPQQAKHLRERPPTQKTRLRRVVKPDAAHQVRKTGVVAEGIKERMHFDVLQNL
jgi:hypothetical protein